MNLPASIYSLEGRDNGDRDKEIFIVIAIIFALLFLTWFWLFRTL